MPRKAISASLLLVAAVVGVATLLLAVRFAMSVASNLEYFDSVGFGHISFVLPAGLLAMGAVATVGLLAMWQLAAGKR